MSFRNGYVIAEVGQNHQGDPEEAHRYVEEFSRAGASALKFQMRTNQKLFTQRALQKPYNSNNAFAPTYGEHREALELPEEVHAALIQHCRDLGVDYMCTPFDEWSLEGLERIGCDCYKVASFDLGNLPFLSKIASTGKPVVMSVGGGRLEQIAASVSLFLEFGNPVTLLHCVSQYPVDYKNLNLRAITTLKNKFPSVQVGLSDHFNGILSGPLGALLGAEVFEKHVTFNRAQKGSDHSFALELEGFRKFARDIRRAPEMLGDGEYTTRGEEPVFQKLGKSCCARAAIEAGEVFSIDNLTGVIDIEQHLPVRESSQLIGRPSSRKYAKGELIDAKELTR
jgi:sialic acid synthase